MIFISKVDFNFKFTQRAGFQFKQNLLEIPQKEIESFAERAMKNISNKNNALEKIDYLILVLEKLQKSFNEEIDNYIVANSTLSSMAINAANIRRNGKTQKKFDEYIISKYKNDKKKLEKASYKLGSLMYTWHLLIQEIRPLFTGESKTKVQVIADVAGTVVTFDVSELTPNQKPKIVIEADYGAGTYGNPFSLAYKFDSQTVLSQLSKVAKVENGQVSYTDGGRTELLNRYKNQIQEIKKGIFEKKYANFKYIKPFDSKDSEIVDQLIHEFPNDYIELTEDSYLQKRADAGSGKSYKTHMMGGDNDDREVKFIKLKKTLAEKVSKSSQLAVNFQSFSNIRSKLPKLISALKLLKNSETKNRQKGEEELKKLFFDSVSKSEKKINEKLIEELNRIIAERASI